MAAQYAVHFEGQVIGPFTTNNGTVADTDAKYWSNHHTFGAPISEMTAPADFVRPFRPGQARG